MHCAAAAMKAILVVAAVVLLASLASTQAEVQNQTETMAAEQNHTIPDSVKEIPQATEGHGVSGHDASFDEAPFDAVDAEADSGPENTFEQENSYYGGSEFGFGPWGYRGRGWGPFRGGWRRRRPGWGWGGRPGWGWGGRPGWGWGGHW